MKTRPWISLTKPQRAEKMYRKNKMHTAGKNLTDCCICGEPVRNKERYYDGDGACKWIGHQSCVEDSVNEYRGLATKQRILEVVPEITIPREDTYDDMPVEEEIKYAADGSWEPVIEADDVADVEEHSDIDPIKDLAGKPLLRPMLKDRAQEEGVPLRALISQVLMDYVKDDVSYPPPNEKAIAAAKRYKEMFAMPEDNCPIARLEKQLAERDQKILDLTATLFYQQGKSEVLKEWLDSLRKQ